MSSKHHSYLEDIPNLHSWDNGRTWNTGGFTKSHLSFIIEMTSQVKDARVIETGTGNSSIAFLLSRPQALVSIAPDAELFSRIEQSCEDREIETSMWEKITNFSQVVLPDLRSKQKEFDIGLIDGAHGWPHTFIDLYYIDAMLTEGGYLLLDDTQLHSVKEMAKLVKRQTKSYALVTQIDKLAVFRKVRGGEAFGEWTDEPYIFEMSELYSKLQDPFGF